MYMISQNQYLELTNKATLQSYTLKVDTFSYLIYRLNFL